jgi:23S rRNA (uracil1939-C5)-methyltransferase
MQNTFSIKVEKIAHDGAAEAMHEGKPVRVHGMLTGEEGIVEVHKKHGIWVGVLKELTHASPSRMLPEELHYLACSPWQVMEYPTQVELKHTMISELFGYYANAPKCGFTPASKFYGYRTKIEFSFCDRSGEDEIPLSLAFHERGGGSRRLQLERGCALASENMNTVALELCKRLRESGYTARDLKTLIVRESKSDGNVLAMLFAKKTEIAQFAVDDIPHLAGFIVFHSTEKSPASVPTKELWRVGDEVLHESILGTDIQYSWDSFFQNNIPVFEEAMHMMIKALPADAHVLELYSGVGTIGLLLAKNAAHVHGVEIVQGAVDSAKVNAVRAQLLNYVAECIPAEKMDARLFDKKNVLVLDPPRVGLHPKIIEHIRTKLPEKIIYLSCNPETQARDYSLLAEQYSIDLIHGFDFYPQTPHCESLIVLSLRSK